MTDTYFPAPKGGRRLVLLCMGASLLIMLLVSLIHRLGNPSLVVEASPPRTAGQSEQGGQGGMNPEVGALMRKVAENPQDIDTLVHLTEHLVGDQQWEPAETFARRAMTVAPSHPQPPYLLGIILHNTGKHTEAAAMLERVIALKDDPSARYSLGVLQIYYLNNTPKGLEHLNAALAHPAAPEPLKKAVREELEKAGKSAQ